MMHLEIPLDEGRRDPGSSPEPSGFRGVPSAEKKPTRDVDDTEEQESRVDARTTAAKTTSVRFCRRALVITEPRGAWLPP